MLVDKGLQLLEGKIWKMTVRPGEIGQYTRYLTSEMYKWRLVWVLSRRFLVTRNKLLKIVSTLTCFVYVCKILNHIFHKNKLKKKTWNIKIAFSNMFFLLLKKKFSYMAFPLFCEQQGEPKRAPQQLNAMHSFLPSFCWIWKFVPGHFMVLMWSVAHFLWGGSHKISKHFLTWLVCFVRYPILMRVLFVPSKATPIEKGLLWTLQWSVENEILQMSQDLRIWA